MIMRYRSRWFALLAAQLACAAGCSGPDLAPAPGSTAEAAVETPPPAAVPTPDGCYSKFVQQPVASGKVDIVFVTDTSTSLADEQDAVADALDRLITGIDRQGDYHIAVLPAHGSLGPGTGQLWKGAIELCPTCTVSDPGVAGALLKQKFADLRSDPPAAIRRRTGARWGCTRCTAWPPIGSMRRPTPGSSDPTRRSP